jgi:hypothetical protein
MKQRSSNAARRAANERLRRDSIPPVEPAIGLGRRRYAAAPTGSGTPRAPDESNHSNPFGSDRPRNDLATQRDQVLNLDTWRTTRRCLTPEAKYISQFGYYQ